MSQQKHTATLHAWLSTYHSIEGLFDGTPDQVTSTLAYTTSGPGTNGYLESQGYTYIGTAEITVTVGDRTEIVTSKVQGLKEQQRSILAKAQAESTQIEEQIQKLLAIGYEGSAT